MSEHAWKNDEDSMSSEPLYSSIFWKIVAHNYSNLKVVMQQRYNLFTSCLESCVNYECVYEGQQKSVDMSS